MSLYKYLEGFATISWFYAIAFLCLGLWLYLTCAIASAIAFEYLRIKRGQVKGRE